VASKDLECAQDVGGVGADAVVGVGFGEEDFAVAVNYERGREWEMPGGVGVLLVFSVDEGQVDEDRAEVGAHRVGKRIGDAELGGEGAAGIREYGEGERVLLHEEVVLARELRRDGDEQRTAFANGGIEGLPGFELGDAVGAPTAAEEIDDERAEGEEVVGADELAAGGCGEHGGGGGRESEAGCSGADGEDARLDAVGEEVVDGSVGDGEALGLHEGAGLGGDGVELGLEIGRHLLLV